MDKAENTLHNREQEQPAKKRKPYVRPEVFDIQTKDTEAKFSPAPSEGIHATIGSPIGAS